MKLNSKYSKSIPYLLSLLASIERSSQDKEVFLISEDGVTDNWPILSLTAF